ncbi:MAG: N-acetylmuramoyl-L-alanine amidase [Actinomycetota bacterium]|nr:N-acetylmuramoyl-L-alanine amidase [Actinomycetota bacterium]
MSELTRRQFIGAAAGLSLVSTAISLPAAGLSINPRSSWAGAGYEPKGPLDSEDVRFLIVHHSASQNGHTAADVPGILRGWFNFHTGPEKGWNDIAYNFVIDSEGGIWEAREGSVHGPVAGDATGGNQGFTQLVAIIGDYNSANPTQASLDSLTRLLAWLADRYGISTAPGARVSVTSRGSNLWPAGTEVTTPTITGHRSMSKTTCPGDNLYPYVAGALTADVEAIRGGGSPATTAAPTTTTTTTPPTPTTTAPPTTTTTVPPTTTTTVAPTTTGLPSTTATIAPTSSTAVPTTTASPPTTLAVAAAETAVGGGRTGGLIGAAAMLAAGAGLIVWRWRRLGGH